MIDTGVNVDVSACVRITETHFKTKRKQDLSDMFLQYDKYVHMYCLAAANTQTTQMCINPRLKIVPNQFIVYPCLTNI